MPCRARPMSLPQLLASSNSRNSAVVAVTAMDVAAIVAVDVADKNAIPNGRSAWCKSAVSPRPSKAARK